MKLVSVDLPVDRYGDDPSEGAIFVAKFALDSAMNKRGWSEFPMIVRDAHLRDPNGKDYFLWTVSAGPDARTPVLPPLDGTEVIDQRLRTKGLSS